MNLIYGDCIKYLNTLPNNGVDLCISDPPFGITKAEWDKVPDNIYFDEILRISKKVILFGGNFFDLPKKDGWIIWHKKPFLKTTNHCEMLWTNFLRKNKYIDFIYAGNCVGSRKPNYNRPKVFFTSEKPQEFLQVLINEFGQDCETIIDPFMGVGSTGVACKKLGKNFIGIEKELKHFEIAKKRISDA